MFEIGMEEYFIALQNLLSFNTTISWGKYFFLTV